jgi:membrane protein required for beta-lactamase induction
MDLYNTIIVAIWLTVLYAIWAATEAGDPGYGQASFLVAGIIAHLYLKKLKSERPAGNKDEIKIPEAEFHVDILEEKNKYVFSENSYRKIIWISTIISILAVSLFLEAITTGKYVLWGIISLVFGIIIFIIPIFLPVKDDIETLRKRAEKERTKAWRKGKVNLVDKES